MEAAKPDSSGSTLQAYTRARSRERVIPDWGHFELNDDFPDGVDGLRSAVEKAEARGVHVGVHTLSNFITPDDAYVTPVPDPRLARVGTTILAGAVGPMDDRIAIGSPGFFDQFENDHLRAAVVGREIVRYRAVSESPPWTLLDVERGAFGTRAAVHEAGTRSATSPTTDSASSSATPTCR